MVGMQTRSVYVGDDAVSKRGILGLKYHAHNINRNWDNLEQLYSYAFTAELRVAAEGIILFSAV